MGKKLNLIVFEKEDLDEILEDLKIDISDACCFNCGRKITKDNLGHIAKLKGKDCVFCDNPACFTRLLVEGGHIDGWLDEKKK